MNFSVQSLSHVRLLATPWTAACQLPCPSPTPRACSNSCPSSPWCHPTISSSVVPFSSCLQPFPTSGSFPVSQFFTSGGHVLELQLQHQSFQWIFRTDFLYVGLVWSPCSPRDSQESSPTPQFKSINSSAFSLLQGIFLTQDRTHISCVSCIAGGFFSHWAIGEASNNSINNTNSVVSLYV